MIRGNYHDDGIQFFTGNDFSQRPGDMNRPQRDVMPPHVQSPVVVVVHVTKEVRFSNFGRLRVDCFH